MVTWFTWVCKLRGSVGAWVAWVKFLRELRGLRGLDIFYVGQHFTWVIIFTWVAWVKYIFAWVKTFSVGQFFYVGQHFLCELKSFLQGSKFLHGPTCLWWV